MCIFLRQVISPLGCRLQAPNSLGVLGSVSLLFSLCQAVRICLIFLPSSWLLTMFHYFLILWDSLWLKGECLSCLDLLCVSALTSGAKVVDRQKEGSGRLAVGAAVGLRGGTPPLVPGDRRPCHRGCSCCCSGAESPGSGFKRIEENK